MKAALPTELQRRGSFSISLILFQVIASSNVGRLKIKRKVMKKKRKDDSNVQIVTSTTTSSSAVYGNLNLSDFNLYLSRPLHGPGCQFKLVYPGYQPKTFSLSCSSDNIRSSESDDDGDGDGDGDDGADADPDDVAADDRRAGADDHQHHRADRQ